MNYAAAIALAAAVLAIYVGAMARRFALAPGWGDQRWFSLIAYGAAVYAIGNVATTLSWPDGLVLTLSRVQVAAVLVQLWAWFRFADAFTGRRPGRPERLAVGALLALAGLALIPGVAFTDRVTTRTLEFMGATYKEAAPTPVGDSMFAVGLGSALVVLWRFLGAWRRGQAHAAVVFFALLGLFVFGVNDALATAGVLPLPYLLDVGFVVPVGAVAWSLTSRFASDARDLHGLRGRLETLVEERTVELAQAQSALHQAEKLAALGQFAAGVAHEVNNPAAVVTSNLRYLAEATAEDSAPAEARQSIGEALEAMQRINTLVRRLVDAGRQAASPRAAGSARVRAVVEKAVGEARARSGDRVAWTVDVADALQAAVRPEMLHQVLSSLLHNASDAIPAGRRGSVRVSARPLEDRVELTVTDDGQGLTPEVRRRAFEPFFTTKGEGHGSGLGLAVARALAESHGGMLELENAPGQGARAVLVLPEASPEG